MTSTTARTASDAAPPLRRRSLPLLAAGLGGGTLLALAGPLAASAHVTVTPSDTAAGSYAVLDFAFAHGCEGSPTTALTIGIPEGIESVRPTVHPGWNVQALPEGEGRVQQVVYTAETAVPEGLRDLVSVQVLLPPDAEGETFAFPVLQTCELGSTDWSQKSADGEEEPENPAPTITVTAAGGGDGHHQGHGHDDEGQPALPADGGDDGDEPGPSEGDPVSIVSPSPSDDVLARVLAIGGLAVGAVALVVALVSLRARRP